MPLTSLLEGLMVGFVGAMPIGPIAILCLRYGLTVGKKQGIIVGLGGAVADIVYTTVSLFGITIVTDFITLEQHTIRLCGGIAVIALGIFAIRTHSTSRPIPGNRFGHARLFVSTLLLALSNPVPLLGFTALLSAIGIKDIAGESAQLVLFVAGVFLGSLIWFSLLVNIGHAIGKTLTDNKVLIINRIAGVILIMLGVVAVGSSLGGV